MTLKFDIRCVRQHVINNSETLLVLNHIVDTVEASLKFALNIL